MATPRRKSTSSDASLKDARFLIVEARFYDDIADALLAGAKQALDKEGAVYDVVTVPGALEIPAALGIAFDAAKIKKKPYEGVVALGCVIRGETGHYDIVAFEPARALMDMSVAMRLPIGNGILTVETDAQAWARARPNEQNKGGGAAEAAMTLALLKRNAAKAKR
jgi:6,7-dimethyl-8-ribityllumazine synthase